MKEDVCPLYCSYVVCVCVCARIHSIYSWLACHSEFYHTKQKQEVFNACHFALQVRSGNSSTAPQSLTLLSLPVMVPVFSVKHSFLALCLSFPSNFVTFSVFVYHSLFPLPSVSSVLSLSAAPPDFPLRFRPYMSVCFCLRPSFQCSLKRCRGSSCRIICIILPGGAYKNSLTLWKRAWHSQSTGSQNHKNKNHRK